MLIRIRYYLIVAMATLTTFSSYSQQDTVRIDTVKVPKNAFGEGEKLVYEIYYGIVRGGEATLEVNLEQNGPDYLYHAKANAYTVGMTGKVVTIRDIYESFFDVATGLTSMAIRNVREQNYIRYDTQRFKRSKGIVSSQLKGDLSVPPNTMDVLGAFYYGRMFLFQHAKREGQVLSFNAYHDGELIPVDLQYKGKEIIKCKWGKIQCLKFIPLVGAGSVFRTEDDCIIWFSDDNMYIPIKLKANLKVGAANMEIIDYSGLKEELKIVKKKKQ